MLGSLAEKKGFHNADPYMPLSFIPQKLSFMGMSCSISCSRKGKKREIFSFRSKNSDIKYGRRETQLLQYKEPGAIYCSEGCGKL
jgi:hypothetical protein